jgi:endonuclease III
MKKNRVNVWFDDKYVEDWERFKQVVIQKHGKLNGVIGNEVMNALNLYLSYLNSSIEPQQHTRTDKKKRLRDIMEYMKIENYLELTEKDIRGLIRSIGGMKDKRTEDDYFRCLIDYGFVRHKVRSVYRIDKSKIPG